MEKTKTEKSFDKVKRDIRDLRIGLVCVGVGVIGIAVALLIHII